LLYIKSAHPLEGIILNFQSIDEVTNFTDLQNRISVNYKFHTTCG